MEDCWCTLCPHEGECACQCPFIGSCPCWYTSHIFACRLADPVVAASPSRGPSPSIAVHSSRESSPAEYPPDQEIILEDGYPLQPQYIPLAGTNSAPLVDFLALNAEVNTSTIGALQGLAAIRATEAEVTAARWRYVAARAALRAAQANMEVFRSRRRNAWERLVTLLGDNAICPTGSGQKDTGKYCMLPSRETDLTVSSDDTGDATAVEDMLA